MESLFHDIRFGTRMLFRNPGFAAVVALTLALGIGATTAMFSVINTVLLRPPLYKDYERLVLIWQKESKHNWGPYVGVSFPNFKDFKSQCDGFEAMEASGNEAYYIQDGGEPEMAFGKRITAGFLPLLGASPILGRGFLPEENRAGANSVVLLCHGYWKSRFGGDPKIVGTTLRINGKPCTVIGVLPQTLQFPAWGAEPKLVVPINVDEKQQTYRGWRSFNVVGKLKRSVTLQQVHARLDAIAARLDEQYPINNSGMRTNLLRVREQIVVEIRPVLLILLGAVGCVLLIACANVANLLLVRASGRGKEVAIRAALGAGRWRMIRQLLTESALLALLGGLLGVALACAGVRALVALSPEFIPRVKEVSVSLPVLGFALGISILTGILFGLLPAVQLSRPNLTGTLKEGGRGATGSLRRNRARSLLVVAEVALALILLVGAGLLIRSLSRLLDVNPGFNAENLLIAQISLPESSYQEAHRRHRFYQQALERLEHLPGVRGVALVNHPPLIGGDLGSDIMIEDDIKPWTNAQPHPAYRPVSTNYFQLMSIPLLRGRGFTAADIDGSGKVAVISETMARQLWPNKDPLGRRLTHWYQTNGATDWITVVGIAADVRLGSLDTKPKLTMYGPFLQATNQADRFMSFVLRTKVNPGGLAKTVRDEIRALDKEIPFEQIVTMDEIVRKSVFERRFNMRLLLLFAGVAVVLAAVGIYGVMACSVSQRTYEIGIRMALGAQRSDVVKLVVKQGMTVVCLGLVLGLAGALVLARVLTSQLFEIKATDPATLAGVVLMLTGVALMACYLPARRATKVDPLVALRYE